MHYINMEDLDFDELHRQKHALVSLIWHDPDSVLWGLVKMISAIQEYATVQKLWDFPEVDPSPRFSPADLPGPANPEEGAILWDLNDCIPFKYTGGEWKQIPEEEYARLLDEKIAEYHGGKEEGR